MSLSKRYFIISSALAITVIISLFVSRVSGDDAKEVKRAEKPPEITFKDGFFHINGEKYFIKGIGYSPYRPGQTPGNSVSLELVEEDFRRIKEAGFNTVRMWDMLSDGQLELAAKYGLNVIQATYLQPNVDFSYSGFTKTAHAKVRYMCKKNKDASSIIMYLVMNEPHSQSVAESGVDLTVGLYEDLVKIAKSEDPKRPVSMANAFWTLWLDQSMWDVVCFNTYSYCPPADEIGYEAFVRNLKRIHAPDRPFVVTEMGLSVSPTGKNCYGGFSEEGQAEGLVENFRGLINAGACGGCIFEWNDEWWKGGDPSSHNDHAEEWFGIVGIESKEGEKGRPRKAYYALKEEFMLTAIEPKEGEKCAGDELPVEIHSSGDLERVRYSVDGSKFASLEKNGPWWKGCADISGTDSGLHKLLIEGVKGEEKYSREIPFITVKSSADLGNSFNMELVTDKDVYKNGDKIDFTARLTDSGGKPAGGRSLKLGIFDTASGFARKWELTTDSSGEARKSINAIGNFKEWYYILWAGAEYEECGFKKMEAKVRPVKVLKGEGVPIRTLTAKKLTGPLEIDGVLEDAWMEASTTDIDPDNVSQEGNVATREDLGAIIRVLWDEENIYLAAEVTDDVPMNQSYERIDLWKGDGIELFISVKPARIPEKGYSDYDYQILIGTNGNMWIPSQASGGRRNTQPTLSKAAAKKTETGYILEAQINAINFRQKSFTNFKKDDILGFNVSVDDKDTDDIREGVILWNGTPDSYKNSSVWGRLRLR